MTAHNADEPLYGRAGEPVAGDLLEELLKRQTQLHSSPRKRRAQVAYDVYQGDLAPLVLRAVHWQQESATLREAMAHFVAPLRNDARDVTEQVAVVYKNGAKRHFGGDGDETDTARSDEENALRLLAIESAIDEVAEQVNHLAWLQGPQFVVPMVRSDRLCADVIGPHIYDIIQNEADPLGHPVALAWHEMMTPDQQEVRVYVLDTVSLRQFRVARGKGFREEWSTEHGQRRMPAALMRFGRPLVGDDWHASGRQRRLIDGTVEVNVLMARMGLVRKAQCHMLFTAVGNLTGMAKGQEKTDPEGQVVADTGGRAGTVDFKVHDFDTAPDNFITQVLFDVLCMIEPYGGHIQVDSGQPENFGKVVIPQSIQAEHRKRQIPSVMAFERDYWTAAAAMMRAERHPLAFDIPPIDEIGKRLRVNFGELSRDLEDPEKATAYNDWLLSRGQTSEVQLMQRQLGNVDEDEAIRELDRIAGQRARWIDILAKHNVPADGQGNAQTMAQANGAMGTPQREANKQAAGGQPQQASEGA